MKQLAVLFLRLTPSSENFTGEPWEILLLVSPAVSFATFYLPTHYLKFLHPHSPNYNNHIYIYTILTSYAVFLPRPSLLGPIGPSQSLIGPSPNPIPILHSSTRQSPSPIHPGPPSLPAFPLCTILSYPLLKKKPWNSHLSSFSPAGTQTPQLCHISFTPSLHYSVGYASNKTQHSLTFPRLPQGLAFSLVFFSLFTC